jgi:ATP-dependent DNA helicase RecG
MIYHFPRRYDDYSHIQLVSEFRPGVVTAKVTFSNITERTVRRGLHITQAVASDESGSVAVVWFNQRYRAKALHPRKDYYITGEFVFQRGRYQIMNPSAELAEQETATSGRIAPTYPETKGLRSYRLRKILLELLPFIQKLPETLPSILVNEYQLLGRAEALAEIHFPSDSKRLSLAKHRLGFEELFETILASLLNKADLAREEAIPVPIDTDLAKRFVDQLPYVLTDAQRVAAWQILNDLARPEPMNRLLEGDVGSGKTMVASLAALMTLQHGYQVAYMAPTELLARQQADSLAEQFEPYGVAVGLLVGSMKSSEKVRLRDHIAQGQAELVVGTHALITEQVEFSKLAFIVIDEQHRFGVEQRKKLLAKASYMPHVLTMTATPIPRSLALTVYGELDVSIIDQLPPNRKPIITELLPPSSRAEIQERVLAEIEKGHQAYIVYPLIDQSDSLVQTRSAEADFQRLQQGAFKNYRVGLLHGRLAPSEKEAVMASFAEGSLDILIATTVVEVGVNVPNATIMVIESAERFGLAQLHQLRGRVGRSSDQAYCLVVPSSAQESTKRLRAFASTTDGFALAELDLEQRGPGQLYGVRQSGVLDLRLADIGDQRLVAQVRQAASDFIASGEDLVQYPRLYQRVSQLRKLTNLN